MTTTAARTDNQPEEMTMNDTTIETHTCCYHVAAGKAVLADRERELLKLKGPCSTAACRLHYAHSGPCDIRATLTS